MPGPVQGYASGWHNRSAAVAQAHLCTWYCYTMMHIQSAAAWAAPGQMLWMIGSSSCCCCAAYSRLLAVTPNVAATAPAALVQRRLMSTFGEHLHSCLMARMDRQCRKARKHISKKVRPPSRRQLLLDLQVCGQQVDYKAQPVAPWTPAAITASPSCISQYPQVINII